MDNNQRKQGIILSYISIITNIIVQIIYTPFLIRFLGQSEYGLYSLVYSIIGYLTVLDLGFGNAIVVYTSKYKEQKKYNELNKLHGMFKIIFFILGIIAVISGLILYNNVNKFFGNTMTEIEIHKTKIMMLILTFNLGITFMFNIYSAIITAYEKFVFQKVLSIINTILKPLLTLPLLILGYKSITMCLMITIVNLTVLIINYIYCRKKLKIRIKYCGFDKKIFKEISKYSFFVFLIVIVDKINWSVDQFILGAVAGTTAVSLYAVASHLNSLFINFSTAISGVLLPKISKMIALNASNNEISKEFIKVGRLQYYIIFIMASGLCIFGKDFFIIWAGKEYVKSYYIAIILILPLCVDLIQSLGNSILQAKNIHKFKSILYFIIALFNIIISIPLGKKYGGIGAAIGTSISLIIGNIIIMNIYYYCKAKIDIKKFWNEIFNMTIIFFIPVIFIIIIINIIKLTGLYKIIILGSIYVITYSIISYYFVMNDYEKNIIKNVFKKLRIIKWKTKLKSY